MAAKDVVVGDVAEPMRQSDEGSESCYEKPNMVRFPKSRRLVPPPQLQVESEEESEKSGFLLWQVYAFGGYIVLKWLWGKWQERQNQKGNPDE